MSKNKTEKQLGERVRIAAFDFDGTCIDGNSPVLLVRYLGLRGKLRLSVLLRILVWAFAYKIHIPQNESWVRGLVFTAFEGMSVHDTNRYLATFYDECIDDIFRARALKEIEYRRSQGCYIVAVSATFAPILDRAQEHRGLFDHVIATHMHIDSAGCYTREVACTPIEGKEKPQAITQWANESFGKGNWELVAAYGNHYSDCPLLEAATEPFAVTPGITLARYAKKHSWPILDW